MSSTSAPYLPIGQDNVKVGAFVISLIGVVLTISTAWGTLSGRIQENSTKVENTEKRIDKLDIDLDKIDGKLDKILERVSDINVKMERKQDKK